MSQGRNAHQSSWKGSLMQWEVLSLWDAVLLKGLRPRRHLSHIQYLFRPCWSIWEPSWLLPWSLLNFPTGYAAISSCKIFKTCLVASLRGLILGHCRGILASCFPTTPIYQEDWNNQNQLITRRTGWSKCNYDDPFDINTTDYFKGNKLHLWGILTAVSFCAGRLFCSNW